MESQIDGLEMVAATMERNLEWAAKLLLGKALLVIHFFVDDDAEWVTITPQQLEWYATNCDSVVVYAAENGAQVTEQALEAGIATWLGDIVDGEAVCGSFLVELL